MNTNKSQQSQGSCSNTIRVNKSDGKIIVEESKSNNNKDDFVESMESNEYIDSDGASDSEDR